MPRKVEKADNIWGAGDATLNTKRRRITRSVMCGVKCRREATL